MVAPETIKVRKGFKRKIYLYGSRTIYDRNNRVVGASANNDFVEHTRYYIRRSSTYLMVQNLSKYW